MHPGLTAAMYGEIIGGADGPVLNVAAGDTNLQRDLADVHVHRQVVSLDPAYTALSPDDYRYDRPDFVPGLAQDIPFGDNQFAVTICQFGMQHVPEELLGDALREMARVTMPASGPQDTTRGIIFVNPVFDFRELQAALDTRGVAQHLAGVGMHSREHIPLRVRKAVLPSLWIHKTPELTPERLGAVVDAVIASRATKPGRREIGELVSRLFGGSSYM